MQRRGGFSILEVMIAVAILGVFALIGGIAMQGSFGESRARGAVRNFADLMMFARTEAIRTGLSQVPEQAADRDPIQAQIGANREQGSDIRGGKVIPASKDSQVTLNFRNGA